MRVTGELIDYLEKLSYLSLGADEKKLLSEDLEAIINGFKRLEELDTANIPEPDQPFDDACVFREDIVQASFDRELILKNAPRRNDEMFVVPKVI